MPQGRHRQAPPLHRLLAPTGVAVAALLCAGGGLFVDDLTALRAVTAGAAVAALTGAVLMRVWDWEAGRRVSDVRAAKANVELLAGERAAELEADARQSRVLRAKLERRLRAKREQLAKLRTEHAALLQRYANAETQRASALEGRRQLAIAAAEPVRELTTGAADHRTAAGAPSPLTYLQADQALSNLRRSFARQRTAGDVRAGADRVSSDGENQEAWRAAGAWRAYHPGARTRQESSGAGFSFFGGPPRTGSAAPAPNVGGAQGTSARTAPAAQQPLVPGPAAHSPSTVQPAASRPTTDTEDDVEGLRRAARDPQQVVGKVIDLSD